MVRFADASLTGVGFRRDLKLFLGLLVGFLAILITLLVVMLQGFLQHTTEVSWSGWNAAADSAVRDLAAASQNDPGNVRAQVPLLQSRYGIAGVVIERLHKRPETIGVPANAANVELIRRNTAAGSVVFVFDASTLRAMTHTFQATALTSLLASIAGIVLLILYLPRITGPIEEMLDSAATIGEKSPAVDEQVYLIETFRGAIEKLKAQEAELLRLHHAEKMRADDLERVTAALTRSLTSGFLSLDPEGRIVDLNRVAREILKPESDISLAGSTLAEAFVPSEFTSALESALASHVAITRAEVSTGGSEARVAGLTTVPLFGEETAFLGMLALFTDLTPMRRLETRLRDLQSLADLGEISAGIAHEFRNSLSTILGYLRLVRKGELPEALARSVDSAEREASLLAGAVDALLHYGRPMQLDARPTDVLALLEDIVSRVRAQHQVPIVCSGARAIVDADAPVLARAFENLIRNAVESVEENGRGEVRISVRGGSRVEVRVEDTGVGLAASDVSRLFLPFQSNKSGGYGIGLPLVKKIILLHEGEVRLTGEPGRGATAVVELPASERTDAFNSDTKSNNSIDVE
jgi:signal transduction histidine kinase